MEQPFVAAAEHVLDQDSFLGDICRGSKGMASAVAMLSASSGGHDGGQRYSDEEDFEEDLESGSGDGLSQDFEDDTFEEGLDEGDAQYDEVDDGSANDYDEDDFHDNADGADTIHGSDLESPQNPKNESRLPQSNPSHSHFAAPVADINGRLSSHATSLLMLTAFDVFLLNLMCPFLPPHLQRSTHFLSCCSQVRDVRLAAVASRLRSPGLGHSTAIPTPKRCCSRQLFPSLPFCF